MQKTPFRIVIIFVFFTNLIFGGLHALPSHANYMTETSLMVTPTSILTGETLVMDIHVIAIGTTLVPLGDIRIEDITNSAFQTILTLDALGQGSYSWPVPLTLPEGTTTIRASYLGDDWFQPSEDQQSVDIDNGFFSTITELSLSQRSVFVTETVTLSTQVSSGETTDIPTGSVRFHDITYDMLNETVALDAEGMAAYGWTIPMGYPSGAITLKVEYTGAGQFTLSSDQEILTIESVYGSSVGVTTIPTMGAKIGDSIHVTAHVSRMELRYPLTGLVEFYHVEEDLFLGNHSLDKSTGNASIDWVIPPNYGPYMGSSLTIRADYVGNLYFESASTTTSIQLDMTAYSTETSFTITPNSATPGTPLSLKAQITAEQPEFIPTGDVSFYDVTNLNALGTVTLNAQGVAEFIWTIPTNQEPGNLEIRASYLGESSGLFVPSEQTKQLLIQHFPSSIQLILSETEVWISDSLEIQVEVTGVGITHTPQGTVALVDKTNNYVLDTLTLDTKGKARKTWVVPNTYADGSIELDASYSGDVWLYPSNSAAFPQILNSAPVLTLLNVLENEVVNGTFELEISIIGISNTPEDLNLFVNQDAVPIQGSTGIYPIETETYPDGPLVLLVRGIDVLGNETVIERTIIVDNSPPELSLNVKNGMLVARTLTIEFDIYDVSSVTLLVNGQPLQSDTSYTIDTLRLPDEEFSINVVAVDEARHRTEVSKIVVVDNTTPNITLVFDDLTQTLLVTVTDEHLYATSVYANSESIMSVIHTGEGLEDDSQTQFEVWVGDLSPGIYSVQVDSLDLANNLGTDIIALEIMVSDNPPSQTDPPVTTNPPSQTDPPKTTNPPSQTDPPITTNPPLTSEPINTTSVVQTSPPDPSQTDPPITTDPPLTSEPINTTSGVQTSPPDDSTQGAQKLMKNSFPLSILGFGVLGLGLFGIQKVAGKRGSSLVQRAREFINGRRRRG